MSKVAKIEFEPSEIEEIKKILSKKNLSFIVITCSKPSKQGNMEVEMAYDGDLDLLFMLIENAKERLI